MGNWPGLWSSLGLSLVRPFPGILPPPGRLKITQGQALFHRIVCPVLVKGGDLFTITLLSADKGADAGGLAGSCLVLPPPSSRLPSCFQKKCGNFRLFIVSPSPPPSTPVYIEPCVPPAGASCSFCPWMLRGLGR